MSKPASTEPVSGHRLGIGTRLTTTMMSASLVQFSIGALAPLILADLDLTRARFGVLLSGYYLTAAVTSPLFGRIIGRIGGRDGLQVVVYFAIGGNLAVSAASGQAFLCLGLLFAGLAVAAANPATNLAIAQLPPPHGVLVGIKQAGFQLAGVVAGSLLPLIARFYGWRASFAVSAIVSIAILLSLVTWASLGTPRVDRDGATSLTGSMAGVRALAYYAFFMGIGTANVGVYLALFTHERLSVPAQGAATVVAIVGLSAVVARIGWNVLVEHGRGRFTDQRSVLILIALIAIGATGVIVAAGILSTALVWVGALAMGVSAAAWNGVVMLGLVRSGGALHALGKASGWVQGAFFAGLATGPPVFGIVVDKTGNYGLGWLWTAVSFLAALVAARCLPATSRSRAVHQTNISTP